jgi:hypothetical protein
MVDLHHDRAREWNVGSLGAGPHGAQVEPNDQPLPACRSDGRRARPWELGAVVSGDPELSRLVPEEATVKATPAPMAALLGLLNPQGFQSGSPTRGRTGTPLRARVLKAIKECRIVANRVNEGVLETLRDGSHPLLTIQTHLLTIPPTRTNPPRTGIREPRPRAQTLQIL